MRQESEFIMLKAVLMRIPTDPHHAVRALNRALSVEDAASKALPDLQPVAHQHAGHAL